ncbi:rho GTPase-activating protein 11A-like [Phymastichus coffea]|uniref:rho GTPase-activating protein 11A-like n=1 Tax=Phymastichus coffea TaxID=108790 RepID=UPI00273B3893|nr:rho GTPase-activating protein 11A-like [Phymastichus coffea]
MLIYDVLHKEKVYQIISDNLRNLGVKYRIKKCAVKTEKPERNASALKKVFNTHLSYLPLDVVNLSSGAIIHVPVFVSQATTCILKNITQEGLFRKAGSQLRQKEIIARLDNGGQLGDKNNIIDVGNCLKTFFRNLPEPLIPYIYHDLFVRCQMLKTNKLYALLLACILLPPHHLNTLAYLMEFLKAVSTHEQQNKMGIDNLARVFGPNIMPLQETTMVAVQMRLDAHLNIVKLLIENAEKIGVLPHDISEAISTGSIDNELDQSDPSHSFKNKKKKHRSGSLTRMLTGLKKIVGKNSSPNGMDATESRLLDIDSNQSLVTPSLKAGKKRKVTDSMDLLEIKRNTNIFEVMPTSDSFGHTYLFLSPVSNNPNPAKDRSPTQKSGVQKYLSHKVHSETRVCDKVDRSKKHRLSLDRFVPRSKPKISEKGIELRKKSFSPCAERRLSNGNNSSDVKKRRRSQSISLAFTPPQVKMRNSVVNQALNEIFMDAEVNLSDDCGDCTSQNPTNSKTNPRCKHVSCVRKSTHSYSLRNSSSPNVSSTTCDTADASSEEYVKIPKSEYEEIKNRVSAIESRISQEFKSINNESNEVLTVNPIMKVQNEYEKTLVEANIENTSNTDQLAKRLSRELKIRKSMEHKVIRSPSARKIGSIRRRSQENLICNKKVQRTASWHVADRSHIRNNNLNNCYPKQCNLKRGRPLVKRDSNKSLNLTPKTPEVKHPTTFCSEETNARLKYLQEQLNTLISHTAEHTRGTFSDDDFESLEDDVFQNNESPLISAKLIANTMVRRASSFHMGEFIDNSQYFNKKIKELKESNSQTNLTSDMECTSSRIKSVELKNEKTVSWKDADDYFQQETKMRTPVTQTGRASVAKLRTQNAGMVLAKAKLFDDPTKEAVDTNRRQSMKVPGSARPSMKQDPRSPRDNKRLNNNDIGRRRQNMVRRSPNVSPLIKMEVTISNSGNRQSTRFNAPRKSYEEISSLQKENQLIQSVTSNDNSMTNRSYDNVNIYKPDESTMCKTPHIKRPLVVKTPKSAKQLSSRRASMHPRRTPLKAVMPITPKRQSPRIVLKTTQLTRHMT